MKIMHACLSNFYIDNLAYQENQLVEQHVKDGHDVLVVASTEIYDDNGKIIYTKPDDYIGADGARVIRLPYRKIAPFWIRSKIRSYPGVRKILDDFKPDAILFHGTAGWELRTVAAYVRDNPGTIFYIDSHGDPSNTARGFVSREILHKIYYRSCLQKALPQARKVLCVSTEIMDYVQELYAVPADMVEFYPLGGHPLPDEAYEERRRLTREKMGLAPDAILVVQSGKQTRRKKLLESLKAFSAVPDSRLRFVVAGVIQEDIRVEAERLMASDPRTHFAGWQSPEQLTDLLCAADIYLQPGTQSATMQHALCCRCAVILQDWRSHTPYVKGNGWLIEDREHAIENALRSSCLDDKIRLMKNISYKIALEILDYKKISKRILI